MECIKNVALRHVCAIYGKTPVQVRYAVKTGRLIAEKDKEGWELRFPTDKLPSEWPEAPRNRKKGEVTNG